MVDFQVKRISGPRPSIKSTVKGNGDGKKQRTRLMIKLYSKMGMGKWEVDKIRKGGLRLLDRVGGSRQ